MFLLQVHKKRAGNPAFKLSTLCRQLEGKTGNFRKKFPVLRRLNVKGGIPSPLHNPPMRVQTMPHGRRVVYSLRSGFPALLLCRQTPKHVIASRRERSPDRSASHRSIHGGIWGCLPTARQSVLLQKNLRFQGFQGMQIAPKGTMRKEDSGLRPRQCAVATP